MFAGPRRLIVAVTHSVNTSMLSAGSLAWLLLLALVRLRLFVESAR